MYKFIFFIIFFIIISCSSYKKQEPYQKANDVLQRFVCSLDNYDEKYFGNIHNVYELRLLDYNPLNTIIEIEPWVNTFNPTINDTIGVVSKNFNRSFIESNKNLFLIEDKDAVLTNNLINVLSKFKRIDSAFVDIDPKNHAFTLIETDDGIEFEKSIPEYFVDETIQTHIIRLKKDCLFELIKVEN